MHILINNSKTNWPTKNWEPLLSFSENLFQDAYITFLTFSFLTNSAQNMIHFRLGCLSPIKYRKQVNSNIVNIHSMLQAKDKTSAVEVLFKLWLQLASTKSCHKKEEIFNLWCHTSVGAGMGYRYSMWTDANELDMQSGRPVAKSD